MNAENGYMQFSPTVLQRIGYRLFPQSHCAAPVKSIKECRDELTSHVITHAGIVDRIRFLFSGRCKVTVCTATQNLVGDCASESTFSVLPFKSLE